MNNTGMELPGAPFLYTMGILGMTFIGFSAIVMLLRQTLGRKLRPFDALFAHVYMEFGLVVSVGAMLPPLFALWNLSLLDVWRLSSALVGIPLLFLGVTYPARRRSASGEHTPFYVRVNVSIVILISVALLLTALGIFHEKSPAMFTSALTGFLHSRSRLGYRRSI